MIVGSFGLGSQLRIKRFLAYSGISHVGFILLALYCHDGGGYFTYTLIYAITTLNLFVILIALSRYHRSEIIFIHQLSSSFVFNPYLAVAFALSVLSLAGTPPLLGFFAKYYVIVGFIKTNPLIALIAIVASTISCARYLTLVSISLFSHDGWAKLVDLYLTLQAGSIDILNGNPAPGRSMGRWPASGSMLLTGSVPLSSAQSYIISLCSCTVLLAMLKPLELINLFSGYLVI